MVDEAAGVPRRAPLQGILLITPEARPFFFASCALVSLSLSVTGERDEKQSENKEDAVQPN